MPRTTHGVWSMATNTQRFRAIAESLPTILAGLTPTQSFRRDLLAFYRATGLTPHPQLLPFHPDEEDPSTNPDLAATGAIPIVYDLTDVEFVRLKNWQIDDGSFRGVLFALSHCPHIRHVEFFNAQLTRAQVESLCELLPSTHVNRLHLEWNAAVTVATDETSTTSTDGDAAPAPAATTEADEGDSTSAIIPPSALRALLSPSSNITVLSLRANGLTAQHATEIAAGLRTTTKLEVLNLFDNPLGDDGVGAIAFALPFNSTLKSLSLADTGIGGKAAKLLVDVLTRYAAPPALLLELEQAEPRIQAELDQAKKAKKKIDRVTALQNLGLPVLEAIDGVQFAPGNAHLEDLVLSGNVGIEEGDVGLMLGVLEAHRPKLATHLRRIKLQRIPALQALGRHHAAHPTPPVEFLQF